MNQGVGLVWSNCFMGWCTSAGWWRAIIVYFACRLLYSLSISLYHYILISLYTYITIYLYPISLYNNIFQRYKNLAHICTPTILPFSLHHSNPLSNPMIFSFSVYVATLVNISKSGWKTNFASHAITASSFPVFF